MWKNWNESRLKFNNRKKMNNCYNCKHCRKWIEVSDCGYGHIEADCNLDGQKFGHEPFKECDCKNWEEK